MRKHELVVIWQTGEKEIFEYKSKEKAESAMKGMKMALGNQISWMCVREKL